MSNNDKVTSTDIKKALAEYHSKDYFITECISYGIQRVL